MYLYLEMGVGQDGSGRAKILDFSETGHEFGSGDASSLVHQLNGRPFTVVGHTITNQHVEFAVIVFNGQDHGHRLTDFDQPGDFGSPRTFADLDLHPAADIVASKIGADNVQHVDRERSESDRFLVLVMPSATQFAGLIPYLLHLWVELDDDGIFEECS